MDTVPEQRYGDARERLIVAVLALCGVVGSLQFTLIVPVLPQIPLLLDTTPAAATWLATATLLVGTVGTPVMARLADMYGRRRLLIIAMLLLVLGSVIAALGTTFTVVLIGRSLQGCATAVLPIGIGLLSGSVNRARMRLGIALMSGAMSLGSGLGLALSGFLVSRGGLPAIFWTSALAGVILTGLVFWVIDESAVRDPGRFDIVGTLLLAVGLSVLLLLISHLASWGLTPITIGCFALSALALGLWAAWERRHPSPVIDIRVSFRSPVLQINIASFFATFAMYANHLVTMQEALAPPSLGFGLGLPLASAGLVLVPATLAGVALAGPAANSIARLGARFTLMVGSGIMAAAYVFRLLLHGDVVLLVVGSTLVGIGTAFAFAAMPSLITHAVAPHQIAAANGVNSLSRSLSGALASAALALVLVALPATEGGIFLSPVGVTISHTVAGLVAVGATFLAMALPRPADWMR